LEKSAEAFRTIGEMATELGVRTHILRYWEEQFPMLQPLKRAGGRRHYRPEDVKLLHTISRLLTKEGYTIKGARNFLATNDSAAVVTPIQYAPAPMGSVASFPDIKPELRVIRDRLAEALAAA
jgi:DNA-binding transcriptional MerR regulator